MTPGREADDTPDYYDPSRQRGAQEARDPWAGFASISRVLSVLVVASVEGFPFPGPFEGDRGNCGGNQAFKIEIDSRRLLRAGFRRRR